MIEYGQGVDTTIFKPYKQFWQRQIEFLKTEESTTLDVCIYQGGYGCVAGETLIDLVGGERVPIRDFQGGWVWAWDGGALVPALATKPSIYDKADLFEVKTLDGQEIICTAAHQFLTESGWKRTDHLQVGDAVFVSASIDQASPHASDLQQRSSSLHQGSAGDLPLSNSEPSLLIRALGAQHCSKTPQGFRLSYPNDRRSCDGQLLSGQETYQDGVPSPLGALEHTHLNLREGDRASLKECSQSCLLSSHHSMNRYDSRMVPLVSGRGCYDGGNTSVLPFETYQQCLQSLSTIDLQTQVSVSYPPYPSQFDISAYETPFKNSDNTILKQSKIASIRFLRNDNYYDLHVPGYNNYLAHGFINHNSGKTWVGAFRGLMLAEKYPGSLGLVVAKTGSLVYDTTLPTYIEILERCRFKSGTDYIHHKSSNTITFPRWGGSKILFRSMKDPNRVKSINASWAHGEEISDMTEADFFMLLSRVRDPKVPRRYLFGTTNPQPTKGWIHKHFVENKNKRRVVDPKEVFGKDYSGKISKEVIHYRRIIAPTTDNHSLSPDYIESMRASFDAEYFDIFVMGRDGDYRAGLVVKNFSHLNLLDTRYREDLPLFIGCDFNVDPMCWVFFHRFNNEYHYFDELVMENTTTLEATDEFFSRYGNHKAGIIVTGDASGLARSSQASKPGATNYSVILNRLSELGAIRVQKDLRTQNPNVRDRIAAWNSLVCNTDGVRRIFINPDNCKWLLWNMDNMQYIEGTDRIWEPITREIKKDKTYKYYKHPWDAASYAVEKYDPIRIKPDAIKGKTKIVTVPYRKT